MVQYRSRIKTQKDYLDVGRPKVAMRRNCCFSVLYVCLYVQLSVCLSLYLNASKQLKTIIVTSWYSMIVSNVQIAYVAKFDSIGPLKRSVK